MIETIKEIFNDLELSWIDTSNEIVESITYKKLLEIFSSLKSVFNQGKDQDYEEFLRTIRHIIRMFKIYFLLKKGKFIHDTLSEESLLKLRDKIESQYSKNERLLVLILMYHDIGRFYDRKDHPYQSYHLISSLKLLNLFNLSELDTLFVSKVIQYHLFFATIYTGESTFYGIYSLLNDKEFTEMISHGNYLNNFVDTLELFTFIDILGYSYATIYDHYLEYYYEINLKLKEILKYSNDKKKALEIAYSYSQEWIEWRIAGALRIFQFVDTKPYLTKQFFFNKIKQSIQEENIPLGSNLNWDLIEEKYLTASCKIQIKYGLGILMLLSLGKFQRSAIELDQKISSNLISFWVLLTREISSRFNKREHSLWNVYFVGLPHWSKWNKMSLERLNYDTLYSIIKNSSCSFDNEKKEYILYLDFKLLFE